jgi:long-chain acyl-CoA synthetase
MNDEIFMGMQNTNGEKKALIFNNRIFSSQHLNERVDSLADKLRDLGVNQHHRIGILFGNTPLFVCSLLAIAKIRASAVLFSTHFKKYELENYISDSYIQLIMSDEKTVSLIQELSYDIEQVYDNLDSSFGHMKIWRISRQDESSDRIPVPEKWEDKEFTLQFTSGVGGRSKIVPRSYRSVGDEIVNYIKTINLTSEDVVVCPTPFFHAYGLINGFLAPFYQGAAAILTERFIPNDFINLVKTYKPTIFIGVPFMYDILCKTYLEEEVDFYSLRICFSAGAKLSPKVAEGFTGRFGVRINQQYGSTETGTMAVNLYRDGFDNVNSVGHPLPGREMKVVDQNDRDVPVGEEGEIKIRSQGTTNGYLYLEELNKQKFKDGWYFTGDIGRMDTNGNIFITGRKIAFINVAGLKVDPFEVEGVLLSIDAIKECAVVGKEDKTTNREIVKAFVVVEKEIDVKDIKGLCKERLADYKVPRDIEFVKELPKSPTGKILVKYLLD